jgi:hypothetical protein
MEMFGIIHHRGIQKNCRKKGIIEIRQLPGTARQLFMGFIDPLTAV